MFKWHSVPSYLQSTIISVGLKPRSTFALSGSAANVSVNCSFLIKSSRRASRSGNALPFIVVGASNLGVSRSPGAGVVGGLLAQSEASLRVSRSQNVQVGVEGKQQRQQQWTFGGDGLVSVDCKAVVDSCSGDVNSDDGELANSVVDSLCTCINQSINQSIDRSINPSLFQTQVHSYKRYTIYNRPKEIWERNKMKEN